MVEHRDAEIVAAAARDAAEDVLRGKYGRDIRITAWDPEAIAALWPDPKFDWEYFSMRAFGYQELKLAY